jgi:hypothetical protein
MQLIYIYEAALKLLPNVLRVMNPNTMILVSEVHGTTQKSVTQHMTCTSQGASHDNSETASVKEV